MKHFSKNIILLGVCLLLLAVNVSVAFAHSDDNDKKEDVCHCERAGQGDVFQCQTLNISHSAVEEHLNNHQADYSGQCQIPSPTPEPSPSECPNPTPTPPVFLTCENLTEPGNPHYDTGLHQIAGGPLLEGRDDVYSLGDGYYTQCYCSPQGRGIQTNWIPGAGPEWGPDWGLPSFFYNYQNRDYNCGQPTPTVTPPPEVTPTPTGAPQPCNGCGGWPSAPSCGAAKPSTPTLLSVDRHGTTATLTWTASSPVTHYAIEYGLHEGEYIYGAANVGNVTAYTVGSLDPNTKYYFAVVAVNDCMPSDPSTTGQVLGAAIGGGEIKGLAFTGNSSLIYSLITAGCAFLILSLASFRNQKRFV